MDVLWRSTVRQDRLREALRPAEGACEVIPEDELEYDDRSADLRRPEAGKLFLDSARDGLFGAESETDIRESIYSSLELNSEAKVGRARMRKPRPPQISIDLDSAENRGSLSRDADSQPKARRPAKPHKPRSPPLKTRSGEAGAMKAESKTESFLLQDKSVRSSEAEDARTGFPVSITGASVGFSEPTFRNFEHRASPEQIPGKENPFSKATESLPDLQQKADARLSKAKLPSPPAEVFPAEPSNVFRGEPRRLAPKSQRVLRRSAKTIRIDTAEMVSGSRASVNKENAPADDCRHKTEGQGLQRVLSKSEILANIEIPDYSNYSFRSNDLRAAPGSETCSGSLISNSVFLAEGGPSFAQHQSLSLFLQTPDLHSATDQHVDFAAQFDFSKAKRPAGAGRPFFAKKKRLSGPKQAKAAPGLRCREMSAQISEAGGTSGASQRPSPAGKRNISGEKRVGRTKGARRGGRSRGATLSNEENAHFDLGQLGKPAITFARPKKFWAKSMGAGKTVSQTRSFPRKNLKPPSQKAFSRLKTEGGGFRRLHLRRKRGAGSLKKVRRKKKRSLGAPALTKSSGSTDNKFSFRFSEVKDKQCESSVNCSAVLAADQSRCDRQVNIQEFIRQLDSQRGQLRQSQRLRAGPKKSAHKSVPFPAGAGKGARAREAPGGLARSLLKTGARTEKSFRDSGYADLKRKLLFGRRSHLFLKRKSNRLKPSAKGAQALPRDRRREAAPEAQTGHKRRPFIPGDAGPRQKDPGERSRLRN